ncbi:uncharacterized protein LOC134263157 [Saccostrea cucullata]|uniref:uncharacterized protein LOC134263157 n=1 Tax=Saccostrea cuccullata TaxID=36930 RepID=UPI002ED07285
MEGRKRFKNGRFKVMKKNNVETDINNNNVDCGSDNAHVTLCESEPACQSKSCAESSTDAKEVDSEYVLHGRRIIDFKYFAEMLFTGCPSCKKPLHLVNVVKERKYGLASIFYIKCECGEVTSVATGRRQNDEKNGQGSFHINTKLGVALVHAGIGEAAISRIFATLNIPCISPKSLKKQERKAGSAIEKIANESCDNALAQEAEQSSNGLVLSYDAGWQKRGSGRNYSSLSGHGSMFGLETKKLVGFSVKNKTCRKCDIAFRKGEIASPHDCRKNWDGSSKAMEPAMAVDILNNIKEKGHQVRTIVMDDDATTIAKIRREVDESIHKSSDRNHTVKNFTNTLYTVQKDKKLHKVLSSKTINHIKKCFCYALASNKDSPSTLRDNLLAIPHHLYGDHQKCSETWCRYLQRPDKYIPKNLPYGKYLSDKELFTELNQIFTQYSEIADKLSTLESTQRNENFNQMVAHKNPKNRCYSTSESTSVRVAAAVCQQNMGEQLMKNWDFPLVEKPKSMLNEDKRKDKGKKVKCNHVHLKGNALRGKGQSTQKQT